MRLRNVKNANEIIKNSKYIINNPQELKGKFYTLFPKQQFKTEIRIEIGMGKGDFIINMAKAYPDINFIGIEKYESVLVRAIQKLEAEKIDNLKLMCLDAIELNEVFDHEIDTIYLNFSDPWPKKRHAKRRLTSFEFLSVYDDIFFGKKKIIQKTDNIILFASSLETLSQYGYIFKKVSLDLHAENTFNVKTEYESKFSGLGFKINYLEAEKE